MSLINDMLRDLEARRAGELAKPDLQREIRPLPARKERSPSRPLMTLAVLCSITGIAALVWWHRGARPSLEESVPPAAAVAPPPVAMTVPTVSIEQVPVVPVDALRLATTLESRVSESAPGGASDSGLPPMATDAQPVKVEATPTKPKVSEVGSGQGSIEKTTVLSTPRERADAEYRRAQGLLAAGQGAGAQEALLASLKQDAAYVPARQMLLRLLLDGRRIDDAIVVLQEGLAMQPAQTAWAMALARLLVERGDVAGAERVLAGSAPYAAGSAEYLGFQGHLYYRLGQFRLAAERYQAACRHSPAEGRWWFGLGQALEAEGQPLDAREAFRRALAAGNLNSDLAILAEQKIR